MGRLWKYRRFVLGMVSREFEQRYLGSALGSLWVVLNPLAMILIYTVVFGQIMRHRLPGLEDGLSYGLFLCAGLLPWTLFADTVQRTTTVFLEEADLLKKMTFPRASLPAIVLLSASLNFVIAVLVLSAFLLVTGRFPGWSMLGFLPLLALMQMLAVGLGVGLGVLNVFFRDVGHAVAIFLQYWFWFTPIVYPITVLPEWAQRLLAFNPMTGIMGGFQQIVLDAQFPDLIELAPQVVLAVLALYFGRAIYRRLSAEMPDFL